MKLSYDEAATEEEPLVGSDEEEGEPEFVDDCLTGARRDSAVEQTENEKLEKIVKNLYKLEIKGLKGV